MSTARFNTWQNLGGTEEYYKCRAWVNFNGTGTVAIRASGNVSSITDNGTGDYTVNFTTALPDANYCFCGNTEGAVVLADNNSKTTTAFRLSTLVSTTAAATDRTQVNVAFFR
jgi:hypothetical protein